jgi:low temperature requirement protein LtrA
VHGDFVLVVAGGMALFLFGTMNFKRISSGNSWYPLSHVTGLWLVGALLLWGGLAHPQTLVFYVGVTATFCLVALWEWVSYHGGWVERMEGRGWRLGRVARRHSDKVRARRERKTG